jgi:hypothetical protein
MRNAYWDKNRRLLIFWVQKSACTAVSHWFGRGVLGVRHMSGGPRAWLIANGYRHDANAALRLLIHQAEHSIAFVRHPFDRLISSYVNKFVTYYGEPIDSFDKLEIFAKTLYCKLKAVDEEEARRDYRGLTLLEFLRAIETICTAAGLRDPELDFHFNRQYPTLFAKRGALPQEVVDVNHLNDALVRINQRYGLSFFPPRSNETRYTSTRVGCNIDVSSLDLASGAKTLSREGFISSETIVLARHAHGPDYDAFGFPETPSWVERMLSVTRQA